MSDTAVATDGTTLDLSSGVLSFTYSGTNVSTISTTQTSIQTRAPRLFIQTFTYSGTNVINISQWVAQ